VGLLLLGGVILGVLTEIAVAAGSKNSAGYLTAGDGLKLTDLGLERGKALGGDWLAILI
jgi:hypothetical protein